MDRLRAMEIFVRVADCGSFTRAAESLDLANATVSKCVSNLEDHLQVTLFNRDTRRIRLTEEGEMFLSRARDILVRIGQVEEDVRARTGDLSGTLRVEAPISVGNALLNPALPLFSRRYPDISISVQLTSEPTHMIERAADLAIRIDHVEDADLIARPLYESRYVMCCSPDALSTLPDDPADLDPNRCIGLLSPENLWFAKTWMLQRGDRHVQIKPMGALHFNTSDAVLNAASAGVGITCILDIFVNRLIDEGRLVQIYEDWVLPIRTFYLVMPKSRANSAKVRAFTEFLSDVLNTEQICRLKRNAGVKANRGRASAIIHKLR